MSEERKLTNAARKIAQDSHVVIRKRHLVRLAGFGIAYQDRAVAKIYVTLSYAGKISGAQAHIGREPIHAEPDLWIDLVGLPEDLVQDLALHLLGDGLPPAELELHFGECWEVF